MCLDQHATLSNPIYISYNLFKTLKVNNSIKPSIILRGFEALHQLSYPGDLQTGLYSYVNLIIHVPINKEH